MRIFITGCAKSGTTLLYRLFAYFKNVELLRPNEIALKQIVDGDDYKPAVGKRKKNSILSLNMRLEKLKKQEKIITDNDIKIVNIVRDGRDVILSSNYKVKPKRGISSIKQRKIFKDIITTEVKYEDLIFNPDDVQKNIASVFGFESEHLFSNYPNGLDNYFENEDKPKNKIYRPRPIDKNSIHKDLKAYKKICLSDEIKPFEQCLSDLNYIRTKSNH